MEKTEDEPDIALGKLKTLAGRWSLGLTQDTSDVHELIAYLNHLVD